MKIMRTVVHSVTVGLLVLFLYGCEETSQETKEHYIIAFDTLGGEELNPIALSKDDPSITLPIPVKEHFTFYGWYTDRNLTEAYQNNLKSVTLYAKWVRGSSKEIVYDLDNNTYKVIGFNGNQEHVVIPKQYKGLPVTIIDDDAFKYADITSITIPNTITLIGNEAFERSTISEVIYEEESQLQTIGWYAFAFTNIDTIHIPNSVISIESGAFKQVLSLEKITFEANSQLTTIGSNAFQSSIIQQITIPKSVTTIGINAFSWTYLRQITFEEGSLLQTIDYKAFTKTELTTITIPASVTHIGMNAFNASRLTTVKFEIGSQIETMETRAFGNNPNLTTFKLPVATPPTIDGDLFKLSDGEVSHVTVYVPIDSEDKYKTTMYWSDYIIDTIDND